MNTRAVGFIPEAMDACDAPNPLHQNIIPVIQRPSEDCYKMNHAKRGYAHIFNHIPDGIDKARIAEILKKLKFEVKIHDQLKYSEIMKELETLASLDYKDVDCLMIVVITHGDVTGIKAQDEEYYPDLLWSKFTSEKCPSLAGKPKIFLIDACRGKIVDKGINVQFDGNSPSGAKTVKIPKLADILIMFSTQDGHYGYGDDISGSWFIQALCEEVEKRYTSTEFTNILTLVNKRVAFDFQGNNPKNATFHETKQVGSIVSSLTRLIYFS